MGHVLWIFFVYPWPLANQNASHPISGTLGEFRNGHLHSGVDIPGSFEVLAHETLIVIGVVRRPCDDQGTLDTTVSFRSTSGIRFDYVHVSPSRIFNVNDTLYPGETVGNTQNSCYSIHLHFEEADGGLNPLRGGGLDPYTDDAAPVIDSLRIVRYDNNTQTLDTLWGKVDIVVKARDPQSLGTSRTGLYRVGFSLHWPNHPQPFLTHEAVRFDGMRDKIWSFVYHSQWSSMSPMRMWYIVTNTGSENRYWNTRLRSGEQWNGPNATTPEEAQTGDGLVEIHAWGCDIQGNCDTLVQRRVVDNFGPYIEMVVMTQGEKGYLAGWPSSGVDENTLGDLIVNRRDTLVQGRAVNLWLLFSEPLDPWDRDLEIRVRYENTGREYVVNRVDGAWEDRDVDGDGKPESFWSGQVLIPGDASRGDTGKVFLVIGGTLRDQAGHDLDGDPRTIPHRNDQGAMVGIEAMADENHWFWVKPGGVCLASHSPGDGDRGVPVISPIVLSFSRPMDTISVRQGFFPWRWGFTV